MSPGLRSATHVATDMDRRNRHSAIELPYSLLSQTKHLSQHGSRKTRNMTRVLKKFRAV